MVQNQETGLLQPFDFEHISSQIPEIKQFNYCIDTIQFEKPMDSSNMLPEDWINLAGIIHDNYEKYNGFVILHGSDTMAYTSSILSFMLKGLNKPVILTGSQLPVGIIRTDGKENLITAIEIAASLENSRPIIPEVSVYFEYALYRGNRTSKISASHFEAFNSPNFPVLAEAGVEISYNHDLVLDRSGERFELLSKLNNNVGHIRIFPGMPKKFLEFALINSGAEAVVLETYGSGNAPQHDWFIDILKEASKQGTHIVSVTQCLKGRVKQGVYETSARLKDIGVIPGSDITKEAAICKSMFLLGNKDLYPDFSKAFVKSIAGEISEE
jgi:L-asparaginase